jgi:hypothetical protein
VEHDRPVADGVLGGYAARLLERAFEEFAPFALSWVLLAVTGQRTWVALVSLPMN